MKINCPEHGVEFEALDGCRQCIEEAKVNSEENIAERVAEVANRTSERLQAQIVKVQYYSETTRELSSRAYTYYSEDLLKVGDIVILPVKDTQGKAKVTEIDVLESEIEAFKDKVKTIPAGSVLGYTEEIKLPVGGLAEAAQVAGAGVTVVDIVPEEEITILSPDMEGTAVVMVDAGKAPSFAKHLEAARRVLEIAKSCEIRTEADAKAVNDDLNVMAELEKGVDAERKTFTVPLNGYLSSINGEYKLITDPLTEAKQIYRKLLTAYKVEQKRKSDEAEKLNLDAVDLARRQAEANNGEFTVETKPVPIPYAPKLTRTDQGKSGLVDHWVYEIIDIDQLSREFMVPDDAMLSSIATKQHDKKPVKGVRFYNEPKLRVSK